MNTLENNQQLEQPIIINSEAKYYLLQVCKWGKFLAIMGYVGIALLILFTLLFVLGSSLFGKLSYPVPGFSAFPMMAFGFMYLILAVIYYFPVSYLYQFSNRMKEGLNSNDEQLVTFGFKKLKSLFSFMGIFMIVTLSIYALAIIAVIVGSMSMMLFK